MNTNYNILTEEKKKLEEQFENARCEFKIAYTKGLDTYSNIKNIDLNRLSGVDKLVFEKSLNNFKTQKFKLDVFNKFISNMATVNMWPINLKNPEFKDCNDLIINCDTFIQDKNGEYTRSVINICGFYFDCPLQMHPEEYINIYIKSLKKVMIMVFGIDYETIVPEICSKIIAQNNSRIRKQTERKGIL